MTIVAPLSDLNNYIPLVEAGAGEFYAGYIPGRWLEKYYYLFPLNRRPFSLSAANFNTNTSLKILRKMIDNYKIKVKMTFNELNLSPDHYPLALDIIKEIIDAGYEDLIFSDPGLLIALDKHNIKCKIHLSMGCGNMNHKALEFFDQFHIKRYIFERKISLHTIKRIVTNKNLAHKEFEAFILNVLCLYSEPFCNSIHCHEFQPICRFMAKPQKKNENSTRFPDLNKKIEMFNFRLERMKRAQNKNDKAVKPGYAPVDYRLGMNGCGLCRIAYFNKIGINYFKIVGREMKLDNLLSDVKEVKKIIEMVKTNEAITDKMIRDSVFKECPGFCYYPEEEQIQ
jgi:putative protease